MNEAGPSLGQLASSQPSAPSVALRLNEQQYQVLFTTMLQGSIFQDRNGQIIAMNPAAERILGRSMAALAGRTSADLEHETLREDGSPFPALEHPSMVALRLGQAVPNVIMAMFNPREQAYRWLNVSAVPLFTPGAAAPYQVYTIFEDITVRKQAEEQARQSAALFAKAFRANPAAMSITRMHDGCFIDINASHERLFGYRRDELVGQRADQIAIYANPDQRNEIVRIMREEGSLRNGELTLRTRSGELREVLCSLEMLDLNGETCMLGSVFDITDRKHAAEQVRHQADLLEQVSDAIISTDIAFTITSWNAAAEALYGWPAQEVIGKFVGEVVPTNYVDSDGQQVAAAFLRAGRWQGEVIQQCKNVTQRSILSSVSLLKDKAGTPVGAVAVNRDITDRKRAEQARQRAADRLRVLADASHIFAEVGADYQVLLHQVAQTTAAVLGEGCNIRLLSDDGAWLDVAALYDADAEKLELIRAVLGYAPLRVDEPSLATRTLHSRQPLLIPIVDRDHIIAATKPEYRPLVDRLGLRSMIFVPMRVQGQAIGIMVLYRHQPAQPPFDEDDLTLAQDLADRAALAISNARLFDQVQADLAERTRIQETLRESEERLRTVTETAGIGLALVDSDHRYRYTNQTHKDFLRLPTNDLAGQRVADVLGPLYEQTVRQRLERAFQGEIVSESLDLPMAPGAAWRHCEVRLELGVYGKQPVVVVVMNDVTERTRAEAEVRLLNAELEQRVDIRTAELTAANQELEAFSYSISHDLRAPLRAIDGFSRILLEDYLANLPDEAQHYFQLVRTNTQQMGRLIDDLLAFSRLSRQPLARRMVDPTELICQCRDELQSELAGRALDLSIGALPRCAADPALLKQVWINLLANAIKYTRQRDPARISISSWAESGETIYMIRDNGVGFDMRYVGKLFGVFQRLHRAEDYEGTGVGLAIVQRIIHRHGGRIWAESAVDQGASFFFTLEEAHNDRTIDRDSVDRR